MQQIIRRRWIRPLIAWCLVGVTPPLLAEATPCAMGDNRSLADTTYCQLSNQLNRPARWIDGAFTSKGEKTDAHTELTLVVGTRFYTSDPAETYVTARGRLYLPNLENKLRIQFTTNQSLALPRAGSGSANTYQSQTGIAAVFTTPTISSQIGLGWSAKGNPVAIAQASMPLKRKRLNSQWGLIPRLVWNADDGQTLVAQLFWDYSPADSNLKWGVDATQRYRVDTQKRSDTLTLRSQRKVGQWTYQTLLGNQVNREPGSMQRVQWLQFSLEKPMGKPWLKAQVVPGLVWDSLLNDAPKPQIAFNLVVDL